MSRAAHLAELKARRASGKSRLETYKVQEEESLYEEVDEEGYKKVVRSRLDRDDFVIDDNGEGYADDGREEWMGEKGYETDSGSEGERPLKGKAGKPTESRPCPLSSILSHSREQPKENERRKRRRWRRRIIESTSISAMDQLLRLRSQRSESYNS